MNPYTRGGWRTCPTVDRWSTGREPDPGFPVTISVPESQAGVAPEVAASALFFSAFAWYWRRMRNS